MGWLRTRELQRDKGRSMRRLLKEKSSWERVTRCTFSLQGGGWVKKCEVTVK